MKVKGITSTEFFFFICLQLKFGFRRFNIFLRLCCMFFFIQVYGETSFDMVAQILEECQNANDEPFIDLGSGKT